MKTEYRKDMYLMTKQRGSGGDLIVGVITSVRQTKEHHVVLGRNLCTDVMFKKEVQVLRQRNVVVRKRDAVKVLEEYQTWLAKDGAAVARDKAKDLAARLYQEKYKPKPAQIPLPLVEPPKLSFKEMYALGRKRTIITPPEQKADVLSLRTALMKARTEAASVLRAMDETTKLIDHEPGVNHLRIAVKALRAIANSSPAVLDSKLTHARGLARAALNEMGIAWDLREREERDAQHS